MGILGRNVTVCLVLLMILLVSLSACGGDNGTEKPTASPTTGPPGSTEPVEDVVITIGNLTDITGVSANAQEIINYSLDDLVGYFNDENLIPGVKLKVLDYDTQFDPSRDIPGYQWLKERGADLFVTGVTSTPVTLESVVNEDEMLLFPLSGNAKTLEPPGWVFAPATLPEHEALTLLKWLAEDDWDYETRGPARIGGTCWAEPNGDAFLTSAEEYVKAHPDQFEWVGAYLTDVATFTWGPQVEALKDCDYVFTPNPLVSFVKEYRDAGYTGRFIGNGPHLAFMRLVDEAELWDEIDGMYIISPSRYWGEDGMLVDLREKLLYENHSASEAESIKRMGGAYNALDNIYVMLDIVRKTAENVGPGNVNSQTLYDTATSYSLVADGVERYSFGETKRYAANYYGVYEADAEKKTLVRVNQDWLYHVTSATE